MYRQGFEPPRADLEVRVLGGDGLGVGEIVRVRLDAVDGPPKGVERQQEAAAARTPTSSASACAGSPAALTSQLKKPTMGSADVSNARYNSAGLNTGFLGRPV